MVARHMGVTMEKDVGAEGGLGGRNMYKVEGFTRHVVGQGHGPKFLGITISVDDT